jgi:hypothetical protein
MRELLIERTCDFEEIAPRIGKESKSKIGRCIFDRLTNDVDAATIELFCRIVHILYTKGNVMETKQCTAIGQSCVRGALRSPRSCEQSILQSESAGEMNAYVKSPIGKEATNRKSSLSVYH